MWNTPEDLNLKGINTVAIDIESYDPNLKTKGSGAIRKDGFVCGIAVATDNDLAYFPLRHSDTDIAFDRIDLSRLLFNKSLNFLSNCFLLLFINVFKFIIDINIWVNF